MEKRTQLLTSDTNDEVETRLNTLKKRRAAFKGKVTILKNYIDSLKTKQVFSEIDLLQLKNRLESYRPVLKDFEKKQSLIDDITDVSDEQLKERELFETEYQSQLASAMQLIRDNESTNIADEVDQTTNASGTKAYIKLPTIDLPHFSGEHRNWLEFRDTFESLIHKNSSLDNIQKFHYLRASLQEEAAEVIESLELSSNNYRVAWDLIKDTYNNTRQLVNKHLRALFNINSVQKESAAELKQIVYTVSKNIRALDSLGETTQYWDTLIIYLITSKLDSTTLRDWEEHMNTLPQRPVLQNCVSFLKNRADLLQNLECTKLDSQITNKQQDLKTHKTGTHTQTNTRLSPNCSLCKLQHHLFSCPVFRQMPVETRIKNVSKLNVCSNCLYPGHEAKSCRSSTCKYCSLKHNTMLHLERPKGSPTTLTATQHSSVLLSTILVNIYDNDNILHTARALLDNGSTSSYITRDLCTRLGLPLEPIQGYVSGINQQQSTICHRTNIQIKSLHNSFTIPLSCLVLDNISHSIPSVRISMGHIGLPKHIILADPQFYEPAPVNILLGADVFWHIIGTGRIQLGKQQPTLQETEFGWLVSGSIPDNCKRTNNTCFFTIEKSDQLSRFWELDSLSSQAIDSCESDACEVIFNNTTTRKSDGRFVVTIPFKTSPECLGDSYYQAKKRFLALERRLNIDKHYKQQYCNFITEYINLGHMTLNNTSHTHSNTHTRSSNSTYSSTSTVQLKHDIHTDKIPACYLPHHGIIHESSTTTKFRSVFDGSAKTSSKLSLNDIQFVGPVIQDDLISILIRFRQHKYIISADIEKIYRQIALVEYQKPLQQIIWRYNTTDPLQTYTLNTVTYGTASAPFLATRCIKQIGLDCLRTAPHHINNINTKDSYDRTLVSEIILHDFYCDDLLTGSDNEETLLEIAIGVHSELQKYQFPLRKWLSNSNTIMETFKSFNSNNSKINLSSNDPSKTLGIYWNVCNDKITYTVHLHTTTSVKITKRIILSTIGHIFDPLGLISPCILEAKIIMQKMWLLNIAWDDEVPHSIQTQWHRFINSLSVINQVTIPRRVFYNSPRSIEVHTFCDASQHAYGACVYIRSHSTDGRVHMQLLMAKGRVAPLKVLTIPRLELCAALTGINLNKKVLLSLRDKGESCKSYYWSDSIIVLSWINSPIHKLKSFVNHKVSDILKHSDSQSWYYVPTKHNPADIITKCTTPQQLINSTLWFSGREFLRSDDNIRWPDQPSNLSVSDLPEIRSRSHFLHTPNHNSFVYNFSNYNKLIRITAYILRFIYACTKKQTVLSTHMPGSRRYGIALSTSELDRARFHLARLIQKDSFPEEYRLLFKGEQLPPRHRFTSLNPFFDDNKLIRVGGRLANSPYSYDKKFPILIHADHYLTKVMFTTYHMSLLHAGPQLLLAHIRQLYWPISGRNLARKTTQSCVTCKRYQGKTVTPIMGQLPEQRLQANFIFSNVGVDYAGPIIISNRKGRGSVSIKAYICIFVCFAVKAVHLELVTDLTTESYLAAMNRFISRRGKPNNIYSDNGRNFVGAARLITNFIKQFSTTIYSRAAEQGIEFHFIPPYAPHFGGLWESTVKSVKHHLKRVLGLASLTYEEMYTLLVQIEGILNSRPLTPLSSDPSDLSALTPFHFLIGRTLTVLPYPQIPDVEPARLPRHQRVELLRQHFWKRFNNEYISLLHQRTKWQRSKGAIAEGSLVIVKDETLPVAQWPLGRIIKVYPGPDGNVRVADIKVSGGTIRRGFTKICPILEDSS